MPQLKLARLGTLNSYDVHRMNYTRETAIMVTIPIIGKTIEITLK